VHSRLHPAAAKNPSRNHSRSAATGGYERLWLSASRWTALLYIVFYNQGFNALT